MRNESFSPRMLCKCLLCKEIQPVHSEGDQPWDFFRRTDAKAETPILWPLHMKSWLIRKDPDSRRDWGQEKGTTEDEMAGRHHRLDGHEFGWTPGVGDGQGGLVCCNLWDCRVGHDWVTELNWTECAGQDAVKKYFGVKSLCSAYLVGFWKLRYTSDV